MTAAAAIYVGLIVVGALTVVDIWASLQAARAVREVNATLERIADGTETEEYTQH